MIWKVYNTNLFCPYTWYGRHDNDNDNMWFFDAVKG